MTRPRVIVFDGLDGCGKGTQLDKLSELLLKRNAPYIRTREPGGCPEAEKIRKFLLSKEGARLSPRDQFDLFWQARELHIKQTIVPALSQGKVVLCDRFDSSTFAFQIYGEGRRRELETLFYRKRNEVVTRELGMNVKYIILDLPAEVAHRRMQNDYARSPTHFDLKPLSYHDRVWQGFHQFKARYGTNVSMINANRTIDEVHRSIVAQFAFFTQ